jgi:hypothetical protein
MPKNFNFILGENCFKFFSVINQNIEELNIKIYGLSWFILRTTSLAGAMSG